MSRVSRVTTNESSEMSLIPYEEKFPLPGYYHIFISGIGPARSESHIQKNNIYAILTLGSENQCRDFNGFQDPNRYKLIEIQDTPQANIGETFEQIYNWIDQALQIGNVLVHCTMGVSRSTSAVICYLMMKFKIPFDQAIGIVRMGRNMCFPNMGFASQLRELEESILKSE